MLESKFWKKLKTTVGNKWRCCRIENSIDSGTPDIVFSIQCKHNRIIGMIELKCQDSNSTGGIKANHYTQTQRNFAILHESTFLFLHSDDVCYLFDWTNSNDILKGQSIEWHKNNSLFFCPINKLDGDFFIKSITNRLTS